MKKVMIGILVLIPVIILLIVAAVSSFVSTVGHISVEDIYVEYMDETEGRNGRIVLELNDIINKPMDIVYSPVSGVTKGKVKVEVLPERATNKTITWQLASVTYHDDDYKKAYDEYLADPTLPVVAPAVMLVDDNGNDVVSNSTGKFVVNAYCQFTLKAMAENYFALVEVYVTGYDVKTATIVSSESNSFNVGESKRLNVNYNPIDSIVDNVIWESSNTNVAIVDGNGVVTAVGKGSADITLKASVYSSNQTEFITSAPYTVEVSEKGSSRFGSSIVVHTSNFTLEEAGLAGRTINNTIGCTLANGIITLNSDNALIATDKGDVTVSRCADDDIVIRNSQFYSYQNGYVLAVSGLKLKLEAKWASDLKNDAPDNVVWSSSNEEIATVSDSGEVTPLGNGIVVITASRAGKNVSFELNVREKVSSMKLATSQASLDVGIAKETVFASHKYVDVSASNGKIANSILIHVQGEPKNASAKELAAFYEAYEFEVLYDGVADADKVEYAAFDGAVANELVFRDTLEGKGKQEIKVKVSAKYPRYEVKDTSETIVIKAVYGVSVGSVAEIRQAALDQKEYALAADNVIYVKNDFNPELSAPISSKTTYAISVIADIQYKEGVDYDNPEGVDASRSFNLYGDMYGNNHKLTSKKTYNWLFYIGRNDITVSNMYFSANDLGDDGVITDDETTGFKGLDVEIRMDESLINGDSWHKWHLKGIRIEYSIFENAKTAVNLYSSELVMDGCIMRNFSRCGIYMPTRMNEYDGMHYPLYSHLTFNNMILSNMLGTAASLAYERYSVFADNTGRFFKDPVENAKYIQENYIDKGFNSSFTQTGFLDIYNWMALSSASIVDTGDPKWNDLIRQASGPLISENVSFEPFRYYYDLEYYIHMGFVATGISNYNKMIFDEKNYLEWSFEDDRFGVVHLCDVEMDGIVSAILSGLNIELYIFGYRNDSNINPGTSLPYSNPQKYISHLRGES